MVPVTSTRCPTCSASFIPFRGTGSYVFGLAASGNGGVGSPPPAIRCSRGDMNGTPFLSRNVSPSPVARHPVSLTPTTFFCSFFFSSAPAALNQPIMPATANPNTMCERVIVTSGTAPECRNLSYHCRGPWAPGSRTPHAHLRCWFILLHQRHPLHCGVSPIASQPGSFRRGRSRSTFSWEAVPRARLRPPAFVDLDEELLRGA